MESVFKVAVAPMQATQESTREDRLCVVAIPAAIIQHFLVEIAFCIFVSKAAGIAVTPHLRA